MAMYDIDSNYKCEKHTYASVCQELMYEYEIKTGEVAPSEEYFRYKIKNAKNNGIINKLNRLLGTDIEKLVSQAPEPEVERFNLLKLVKIIYVFLTIFLYLLKCPQSLILSALRAFCFCGKPHISRSIFLYFLYQTWLKSW